MTQKEFKSFSFQITETKEEDRDGKRYGIVKGYASTYGNVDRGGDRVMKGAFTKSLGDYQARNRPVKMYFQHNSYDIIGGFPVDKIKEDETGLYVEGEINLKVQRGKEAYALAKQGVLSDFSIGYSVDDYELSDGVRDLKTLKLWEVSLVGEPMNQQAIVTDVKSEKYVKTIDDVENITKKEFEELLRETGAFSRQACVYIASRFNEKAANDVKVSADVVDIAAKQEEAKEEENQGELEITSCLSELKQALGAV